MRTLPHRGPHLAHANANAREGIDIWVADQTPRGLIRPSAIRPLQVSPLPDGPDRLPWLMGQILRTRITLRGFIIFQDFGHLYPIFAKTMRDWLAADQIRYRKDVVDGLEQAPQAFIGLLRGENFGKRVIRVGPMTARGSSAP